jgi:hypothetical protein
VERACQIGRAASECGGRRITDAGVGPGCSSDGCWSLLVCCVRWRAGVPKVPFLSIKVIATIRVRAPV